MFFSLTQTKQSTAYATHDHRSKHLSLALSYKLITHYKLQTALFICNSADGVCAIPWLTEDCLVPTYFAEHFEPDELP